MLLMLVQKVLGIDKAIKLGLSESFRSKLENINPIFGKGNANDKIYEILKKVILNDRFFHKKGNDK